MTAHRIVAATLLIVLSAWVAPALAEASGRGHGGHHRAFGGHWPKAQGHRSSFHGHHHRFGGQHHRVHGHHHKFHGHLGVHHRHFGVYHPWVWRPFPIVPPAVYWPSTTYGYLSVEPAVVEPEAVAAPAAEVTEVVHPHGKYVLTGDGVTTPYRWVWIPNPPPAPPAGKPALAPTP